MIGISTGTYPIFRESCGRRILNDFSQNLDWSHNQTALLESMLGPLKPKVCPVGYHSIVIVIVAGVKV